MFGRKDARIKELEESLEDQKRLLNIQQIGWKESEAKVAKLEASELKLMGQIRDMDQLIFQMGQQQSWGAMLPYYRKLQAAAETRQRAESDRIATLLIPEMQKAYR